jgi:hypothetical protein
LYNFRVDNVRTYVKFSASGVEVLDCKVEVGTPYSRRPDNEKPDLSPPAPAGIVREGDEEDEEEEEENASIVSSAVAETSSPFVHIRS